jgi:hypothetical protein
MTCGELTASANPSVLLGSASLGVLGTTPSSFNTIILSLPVLWIQKDKNDPQKKKKVNKFKFLTWMFSLRRPRDK